jgi:hypothetical protein
VKVLTEKARLVCTHETGVVQIWALQNLVTVNGDRVLVRSDPERKPILGCSNVGPTIKPCALTLRATEGYSELIRIDGRPVCLDTVTGNTDGTPPAAIQYIVADPGQDFVEEVG